MQEGPIVVVADSLNHRLSLWRLGDGTVWKHLGSPGLDPGQFNGPRAVVVTGFGALVVTDAHRVQVLTVDGAVLCVLDPTAVVGVGWLGCYLYGVALYPGNDEILVTDYNNHRVVAMSWSPEACYFECFSFGPVSFLAVVYACHCDELFVCYVQSGLLHARAFGSQGAQLGQLNHPLGVAVTSKGDVWVVDTANYCLVVLR
jgi:hypothetical protein